MSESDVESDEEFDAALSHYGEETKNSSHNVRESWLDKDGNISKLVAVQFASGRLDRVERILLLVLRLNEAKSIFQAQLDEVIYHAMSQAASRGNFVAIRMICRITAGYDFPIAKQHAAIRMLFFQSENPSCVEVLRELGFGFCQVFDLVKKGEARQVFGRCTASKRFTILQRDFFLAALEGDLEEVQRLMDDEQTNLVEVLDVCEGPVWRSFWLRLEERLYSPPLCVAAARGHWNIVNAILERVEAAEQDDDEELTVRMPLEGYIFHFGISLFIIAAQRNDLSVFSEDFAGKAISNEPIVSALFREAQPEFMEEVILLRKLRPPHYLQLQLVMRMDSSRRLLKNVMDNFSREVRLHPRRRHVGYLLEKIFELRIVSVKVLAPFLLDLLLTTKRVSIVMRVLLFKPRFFIDGAYLNFDDYKCDRSSEDLWLRGVRLLVEAGVKTNTPIPAEYTDLFSLSLQNRCLIKIRGCLKLPVRESVQKLPLSPPMKRCLLYRF